MSSKYDIFDFRVGTRPSGKKVVEMRLILHQPPEAVFEDHTFLLGFLTKDNIQDINKLYGEL